MFKLEFDTENAAFGEDDMACKFEVSRILGKLADKLYQEPSVTSGVVHDLNGNRIGKWSFSD